MQETVRLRDAQYHLGHFLNVKSQKRIAVSARKKALLRQQRNKIEIKRKIDKYRNLWEEIQVSPHTAKLTLYSTFLLVSSQPFNVQEK